MKRYWLLLLLTALCPRATAQTVEQVTEYKNTLIMQANPTLRSERFQSQHNALLQGGPLTIQQCSNLHIDIYPDLITAGQPFDVHYIYSGEGDTTFELYDRREKRKKLLIKRDFELTSEQRTDIRVVIDQPGQYEVVVYKEQHLLQFIDSPNIEDYKSRRTIVVQPQQ